MKLKIKYDSKEDMEKGVKRLERGTKTLVIILAILIVINRNIILEAIGVVMLIMLSMLLGAVTSEIEE